MGYTCFNCNKKTVKGSQHRHHPGVAGRKHLRRAPRTPKDFIPNLHHAFVLNEKGKYEKELLCTKCRRQLKLQGKVRFWTKKDEKKIEVKKTPVVVKKAEVKEEKKTVEKKAEVKAKALPKKVVKKTSKKEEKTSVSEAVSIEDLIGKK